MIVIGFDVHKDTVAASACDGTGREVATATFENTTDGHDAVIAWAGQLGDVARTGMEPSGGIGRGLAYRLVSAGYAVAEVQPRLSRGEATRLATRGKTDPGDARAIARVLLREG